MRLEEIVKRLPSAKVRGLIDEYGKTREDLPNLLSSQRIFQKSYRELPRNLRQAVNFVFRHGGEVNFETIQTKKGLTREDLAILQGKQMLFAIPDLEDPELVVLPHQYFFMADIPDVDPTSLITGLKLYGIENIKRIAAFLELDHNQPKAGCASSIYLHVINHVESLISSLSSEEKKIIKFACQWEGVVETDQFLERYAIGPKDFSFRHSLYPDSLVGRLHYSNPPTEAQKLFLRALLIPVADDRWGNVRQIAIPKELMETVSREYQREITAKREQLRGEIIVYPTEDDIRSNQFKFEEDLKRLFLIVENIRPRATIEGEPYKVDLKKMGRKLDLPEEYLRFLLSFARMYQMLECNGSNIAIAANALAFLNLSRGEKIRLVKMFLLRSIDAIGYPPHLLIETRKFVCDLLLDFHDRFVSLESLGHYVTLLPKYSRLVRLYNFENLLLEEEMKRSIQLLFWLGFVESFGELEGVRLSPLGRDVLKGEGSLDLHDDRVVGEKKFVVQPTMEIVALLDTTFDVLLKLAQFAEIKSLDRSAIFQLSKQSIQRGLDEGMEVQKIADFLEKGSKNRLPQPVVYLLDDIKRREGEIEIKPCGGFLRVKDPGLMVEIGALLNDSLEEIIAPEMATLKTGVSLEQVEERLKHGGYFPKPMRGRGRTLKTSDPPLSRFLQLAEIPLDDELPFSNPAYDQEEIEEIMEFAVRRKLQVEIAYVGSTGSPTQRVIEPESTNSWIVEAFCHLRKDWRMFRLDRISYARLLPVRQSHHAD